MILFHRTFFAVVLLGWSAVVASAFAGERTKYADICRAHIEKDYRLMLKKPEGCLKLPFIVPSSRAYCRDLWDWDSWLTGLAIGHLLKSKGDAAALAEARLYFEGSVLNFLDRGGESGLIPPWITSTGEGRIDEENTNLHKPCLALFAEYVCGLYGDAEWLRGRFPALKAFLKRYRDRQYHAATGLYFWIDDFAIGVDNDPSTFFRPRNSSGNVFLNCLMVRELEAMARLCRRLGDADADRYARESDALKAAVRTHCWDPRDGFYYSVDLNLRPKEPLHGWVHKGEMRTYDCLIQRLDSWSGFMALWAGVATKKQADEIVRKHYRDTRRFNCAAGVRTLSPLEKMYSLKATANPSNWKGPVWGASNWMVWKGLKDYGYEADARELADRTIRLYGRDYEQNGALHEFYDPDTGRGIMNKGFQNWNYLVVEMMD